VRDFVFRQDNAISLIRHFVEPSPEGRRNFFESVDNFGGLKRLYKYPPKTSISVVILSLEKFGTTSVVSTEFQQREVLMRFFFLFLFFFVLVPANHAGNRTETFEDIGQIPGIQVDLRYATKNNFLGEDLYGNFKTAWLHKKAADQLKRALTLLQNQNPGWSLVVFDALRPMDVQQRLWDKVQGTDQQKFVANPKRGSVHNYGFAVDLSLLDEKGKEVDMGTPFDSFEPLAEPRLENLFLSRGELTPLQERHRLLLRQIMEEAGFKQLPIEWWHFDALPKETVKTHHKIVETWDEINQP